MTSLRLFLTLLFVVVLSNVLFAKDHCSTFGGTLYGWHDGTAWVGEGDFYIGREMRHAKVRDVNTAIERHDDMWWGTETATFDFGGGDSVELVTEFTTEHMKNPSGVFHVNENGLFANGKGKFKGVYGRFTSQGPFGSGVVLPAGKVKPPEGMKLYWIGHYEGTVCW